MRSLTHLLSAVLLVAVSQWAIADPQRFIAPGALVTVEGKVTQWPVPTPQVPRDPVPDADGNIYFSVAGGDRIARFDARSQQFREWVLPAGTKPHGMVVTADGKVFFASNGNGSLGELDVATGVVRQHPVADPTSRPYSLTLDASGNVWITERAGRVVKYQRPNGTITGHRMDGEPYGLVFDRRGVLWVTRIAAGKLGSFDPKSGKTTELFLGPGSKPRRLDVAPDGMLWVSLYGAGKLVKVDPATNRVMKEYALPGGSTSGPYSVNVDALGRVWVAEFQTDSVAILEPTTDKFRVIRLPERNSGVRNATIDGQGRYWYIATTTGKLGVIE